MMKKYTYREVESFIEDINNITDNRERWLTEMNISCKYYRFSVGLLYINSIIPVYRNREYKIVDEIIIHTANFGELRFLVTDDLKLTLKNREL